jgi:hypothetical protein
VVVETHLNQKAESRVNILIFIILFFCIPPADLLTKTVEVSNMVFSIIFGIEMILKLLAYGFFKYISDGFNVFDGVIVMFRSVEEIDQTVI